MLTDRLGEGWKKYSLESLLETVKDMYEIKDFSGNDLTPIADILVGVLLSEENRRMRHDLYKMKQKQK